MEMSSTPDKGPYPVIPHSLAAHHASRLTDQDHLVLSEWLNISPSAANLTNSFSPHQPQYMQQMQYSSQPSQPSLTPSSSSAPYSGFYSDFSPQPTTPGNMMFGSSQDQLQMLGEQVSEMDNMINAFLNPQPQQMSPQQSMMNVQTQLQMQMQMPGPSFNYNNFWDASSCPDSSQLSQGYRLPRDPGVPSPYLPTPMDFVSPLQASQQSQDSSMGAMTNGSSTQPHSGHNIFSPPIPELRYPPQSSMPVTPEVFNFMSTSTPTHTHSTNISPVLRYPEGGNTPQSASVCEPLAQIHTNPFNTPGQHVADASSNGSSDNNASSNFLTVPSFSDRLKGAASVQTNANLYNTPVQRVGDTSSEGSGGLTGASRFLTVPSFSDRAQAAASLLPLTTPALTVNLNENSEPTPPPAEMPVQNGGNVSELAGLSEMSPLSSIEDGEDNPSPPTKPPFTRHGSSSSTQSNPFIRPPKRFKESALSVNLTPSCTDAFVNKNLRIFDEDGHRYRTRSKLRSLRAEIESHDRDEDLGVIRKMLKQNDRMTAAADKQKKEKGSQQRSGMSTPDVPAAVASPTPTKTTAAVAGMSTSTPASVKKATIKPASSPAPSEASDSIRPIAGRLRPRTRTALNPTFTRVQASRPTSTPDQSPQLSPGKRDSVKTRSSSRLAVVPEPAKQVSRRSAANTAQPVASGSGSSSSSSSTSSTNADPPPLIEFPLRKFPSTIPINPEFVLFYRKMPVCTFLDPQHPDSPQPSRPVPNAATFNAPRGAFDLYTPRFVKGIGRDKVGLCPVCYETKPRGGASKTEWLSMKFSAYKCYHMQYAHGISPTTALPFSPPIAFRITQRSIQGNKNEKPQLQEGKCHKCHTWVPVEGIKNVEAKLKEIYWWKHAATCHKGSTIKGESDVFIEDDMYEVISSLNDEEEQE